MDFPLAPGAYEYRPLSRTELPMEGWDCFALQTALGDLVLDGILGDRTATRIWRYQEQRGLLEDGIAGIATQRSLCLGLAAEYRDAFLLPRGLPRGHIEQESGFQVGNHTAPYEDNGSRDLGALQRNDRFHTIKDAFNVRDSLDVLCRQLVQRHLVYTDLGKVNSRRAWELAAGSWNAPAYANWLAGIRDTSALQPGPTALATFNEYIEATTAYCRWNQPQVKESP